MRKEAGLPKGWEKCCIRDIAEVIVSPVDKHSLENEEKVLLCNYTDIYYNSNITQDMCFMEATASYNEIKKFSLQVNDVVITKDSETPEDIGVPAYVASVKENLLCGYHLAILRPKKRTDGKFLMYALMNKKVANDFYRYSNGITRFGLTSDAYNKVRMLMPPLGEQKEIADVLSKWDEAIEITERLIKAKEKQFRWLLRTLIGDQCEKSGWKRAKLGGLCQIKKGEQLNVMSMEEGGAYYALNGGIEPSGRTDRWNTEAETITISEGGNSCGYVNFNTERFWSGGHCYSLLQLKNHIDNEYLFFFLKHYERGIMNLRVGSGLPNIQKKDIDKFEVIYPALKEQKKIAALMKTARQEVDILKELVEKYRIQKRGLMQKLLTGEWRVKAKAQGGK